MLTRLHNALQQKRISIRPRTLLILALVSALSFAFDGCGRDRSVHVDRGDWLATVGKDTIDVTEFKQRFEASPIVGAGQPAQFDFLKALVLEKLLKDYAISAELDTSRIVNRLIDQMGDEAVVEAYLAMKVDQRVNINEAEMRKDFQRIIRNLTLDAWAFPDSAEANEAFKKIAKGVAFERLASTGIGPDSPIYLKDQELQYGQADPVFEDAAYSLKLGDICDPFYSQGRWWILKLVRFKQDRIPSEAAFASLAPSLRSTLLRRHRGPEQRQLISELMRGKEMHIDPVGFHWMVNQLGDKLPVDTGTVGTPPVLLTRPNRNLEVASGNNSDADLLDMPLLTISGPGGWTWTRREVIERLATMPIPLVRQQSIPLDKSFGDAMVWLAEFHTIADAATQEGLRQDTSVTRTREMWTDNALSVQGWQTLDSHGWATAKSDTAATLSDVLDWFSRAADKEHVRFNMKRLEELSLSPTPVLIRKTHFPNRLATPYPVAYEAALQWNPK